jgi:hypothetical protein
LGLSDISIKLCLAEETMFDRFCKALCLLALVNFTQCYAGDFAWRKAGLWEVSIRKDGESASHAVKVQQCSDAASEPDVLLSIMPGQENCAPMKVSRSSAATVINTRCEVHDSKVDARMTMTGDFSAAYRGSFSVQYARGFAAAPQTGDTLFEATWLGPCKSGMAPGDMVLSNGITVNVLRDKKAHESKPRPPYKQPS